MIDLQPILANDNTEWIGAVVVAILAGLGSLIQAAAKKSHEKREREEYEQRRRLSEGTQAVAGVQRRVPPPAVPGHSRYVSVPDHIQDTRTSGAPQPVPPHVKAARRVRRPQAELKQPEPQQQAQPQPAPSAAEVIPTSPMSKPIGPPMVIRLNDPNAAALAFIYQEIFAKPKSLRQDAPLWDL